MRQQNVEKFFAYARARYQIFLDREAGKPEPWTDDKILQKWPFCNVFREDDKVTRWFAKNVRDPMRESSDVLLATVVFRMFNRITTGEAIFCQTDIEGLTPFEFFKKDGHVSHLRRAIRAGCGDGPYVTGAYIISTPPGFTKLEGVLEILRRFYDFSGWREWADNDPAGNECTLEAAHEWLSDNDYLGNFHSYEIVTDLRHTYLLENAPDVCAWCSPGPGAKRGLRRLHGALKYRGDKEEMREDMISLLDDASDKKFWPQAWPRWEMREVEHTLCEFDKYERMRLGQGSMKRRFR